LADIQARQVKPEGMRDLDRGEDVLASQTYRTDIEER
jgi:hypothetical protein